MNLTDELERLAGLHGNGSLTAEEFAKAKELLLSGRQLPVYGRGVRRQSTRKLCGLPVWAIAVGPDPERGELRGHARAIFAFGDMATGWFACGGLARGIFAFGGCALGLFALGGCAVGLLFAAGGGAVGFIAVGGGACGYYAIGGGAVGAHALDSARQDPQILNFFRSFLSKPAN